MRRKVVFEGELGEKFGKETKKSIEDMTKHTLKREIVK